MNRKFILVPAAFALLGTLAVSTAQARGPDVQWSVTVGAPVVTLPLPVLRLPVPVVVVPAYPRVAYREPTRWDVDGDGIPNRYDRVYNPVRDRNGDGIADHRAYRARPFGDRDHDGLPNRYDRRDNRYDDRHDRGDRGEHHDRGDWRGPR